MLFYFVVPKGTVHKLCRLGRGGRVSPKDNLLHRLYLIKKTTRGGGGGQKLPILRRLSLWKAPNHVNMQNLKL
jgi:hypothetical protein